MDVSVPVSQGTKYHGTKPYHETLNHGQSYCCLGYPSGAGPEIGPPLWVNNESADEVPLTGAGLLVFELLSSVLIVAISVGLTGAEVSGKTRGEGDADAAMSFAGAAVKM